MISITVYMQSGETFTYKVKNVQKARQHAHRIINYGWRNCQDGEMEYYPVHQILKVKFSMPKKDKLAIKYTAES
jgi:hypothetical protein